MSLEGPTDEALARQARDGDRRAFELLVGRFKGRLYRFIRRYVGDADDAYDVLQDTFVSAWSAVARYDPARPFPGWLRTIALNKCRDFGRRRRAKLFVQELFAREPAAEPATADPSREERHARLDAAVAALPAKYKEPLLLTTLEGLSHKEAADQLQITPKAVEMRLFRARRLLAERLGPERP